MFGRVALKGLVKQNQQQKAAYSAAFTRIMTRGYNFASTQYVSCFGNLPEPDVDALRRDTLKYLEHDFDSRLWYNDPVVSLLNGVRLQNGIEKDTVDAFGRVNGRIVHANESEVKKIIQHVKTYESPHFDLRERVREIEKDLLTEHAGFLIGNQALDFNKQDGVTELEESTMANAVERRMNDCLLDDEIKFGRIDVKRNIAIVGCVSNFSNFLDLFRKTLRNMELGVPCLVLSRSNTTQHTFRWAELLSQKMIQHDIDPGMLTYASCDLEDIKLILAAAPDSPMYITCSRELAKTIKTNHNKTISSTGGPNTLVATELTPEISEAIRFSASIENSGQCTALRHAVVPCLANSSGKNDDDAMKLLDGIPTVHTPADALKAGQFAGIFDFAKVEGVPTDENYKKHPNSEAYLKVSNELPTDDIDEYWRRVVVDVTTTLDVDNLAKWLVRNQPISLAVNGSKDDANTMKLGLELFEKTGLVVYTVGTSNNPALTCQARPQEGEIFGEFPPRRDLLQYTEYPVVVPSPTAAYNAYYHTSYLETSPKLESIAVASYLNPLLDAVESKTVRGYCTELANYLVDATANGPNEAHAARSVLWGIQRPPINGQVTLLRCTSTTKMDDVLPTMIPFIITNARDQLLVSVDKNNKELIDQLKTLGVGCIHVVEEDTKAFEERSNNKDDVYNVITAHHVTDKNNQFPLPGQFVSRLLPFGHIKSTEPNNQSFIEYFKASKKWLQVLET